MLGTPVQLLVGIILLVFAMFLFFLDKLKPGCKRESDNVYSALALAAGILSLLSMADQSPFHAFQLVIFTGVFIALAIEVISARLPDNSPKSMGMSPRDDDRSPRTYRAGFEDNFGAMDDRNSGRQVGGGGRRGRDEFEPRSSNRMEGRSSDSGRGDRNDSGRSDSGRTDGSRSERDRFLDDRPRRRSSSRDDEPMAPDSERGGGRSSSRQGRDEFDVGPRSIPERTSASDMGNRSNPNDRRGSSANNNQDVDDVPRPRRRPDGRPDDNESPRRGRPSESAAPAPASDYLEFRPVEPIPPKESWGPKE